LGVGILRDLNQRLALDLMPCLLVLVDINGIVPSPSAENIWSRIWGEFEA
jgi:hypothetical protein